MRALLKRSAYWVATLLVVPSLLSFAVRARLVGRDRALMGSSQALGLVPGLLGHYLRRAFYARTLAAFHPSATVEFGTVFSQAGARVGADVYLGPGCHLGLVDIGKDALVASGVQIPSGAMTHGIDDPERPIREQAGELRRVSVGEGAWIGAGALVLADVGEGAVVAAGSVVTRPVERRTVVAGVPARVVRER